MSQPDTKNDKNEIKDEASEVAEVPDGDTDSAIESEPIEVDDPGNVVKEELPEFRTGDTIRILYKIIEGDKTRLQPFEGIVIAMKGAGISKTFTVRRIGADNVGVERIFPLFSPNITKIEVKKRGKVRRSKLYYLRNKVGRAAFRIKEKKTVSAKSSAK